MVELPFMRESGSNDTVTYSFDRNEVVLYAIANNG